MARGVNMSAIRKMKKENIIPLANKLGFTIELVGSYIHLVKGEKRRSYKSYLQAYKYLNKKDWLIRKQEENSIDSYT
jgi:hypothetical protein